MSPFPHNLQDAMSRQAQAEREKQARVILGSAEEEVAQKFVNAAKLYATSPEALQLRAMNIIYETTKERGATILMPTCMVDAMNPGAAAFALQHGPESMQAGPRNVAPRPVRQVPSARRIAGLIRELPWRPAILRAHIVRAASFCVRKSLDRACASARASWGWKGA